MFFLAYAIIFYNVLHCHRPTVWPDSSVVKVLAGSARGPAFESRSGHVLFPSHGTFGGSVWVPARAASSKETVSLVPAWLRKDSWRNLFKQWKIVTGRPYGPIAQWSEFSHGIRGVLGWVPVGSCEFSSPVTLGLSFLPNSWIFMSNLCNYLSNRCTHSITQMVQRVFH